MEELRSGRRRKLMLPKLEAAIRSIMTLKSNLHQANLVSVFLFQIEVHWNQCSISYYICKSMTGAYIYASLLCTSEVKHVQVRNN